MRTNHADLLRQRSDLDLLSFCIWGEARGEPIAGKLAVAHVVLNRVNARSWYGRTIGEVILKPFQFSCFNVDNPNLSKIMGLSASDPNLTFCRAIAELTISRLTKDPTGGATHYHAADCRPSWAEKLVFLCRIGNHLFYREHRSRVLKKLSCWIKPFTFRPPLATSHQDLNLAIPSDEQRFHLSFRATARNLLSTGRHFRFLVVTPKAYLLGMTVREQIAEFGQE